VAAAPDLKAVQAEFDAQANAPERDGLQWVTGHAQGSKDGQLQAGAGRLSG
jgi:hypothetical protein